MKKLIAISSAAAIVFDIFTPFKLYFSGGRALMLLLPTVLIFVHDDLFIRRQSIPLILYLVACLLIMFAGSKYYNYPYFIQISFAFASLEHFLVTRDKVFVKYVMVALYGTLLLMVAVSLPLFISMPNLSRLMINAEENGMMAPIMYWTIQYSTLHALPIYSIPLFYFARKRRGIIKKASIICIVAIFILMFYADTTTGVIINIAVFASLMIYNQRLSLKKNIQRLSILAIMLIATLNKTVMISILRLVQPIFSGSSTYTKIDLTIAAMLGQGISGDLESRENLLNLTLDSFISNPLLPELDITRIGQHNMIIDQIVVLGVFLAIPFIWFLIERIKRPWPFLSTDSKPYYLMGIAVLLIMGLVKNFFLLFPACSILPTLFISEELKKQMKR